MVGGRFDHTSLRGVAVVNFNGDEDVVSRGPCVVVAVMVLVGLSILSVRLMLVVLAETMVMVERRSPTEMTTGECIVNVTVERVWVDGLMEVTTPASIILDHRAAKHINVLNR